MKTIKIVDLEVNYKEVKDEFKNTIRKCGLHKTRVLYKDARCLDVMWYSLGKLDKVLGMWERGIPIVKVAVIDYGSGLSEKVRRFGRVVGESEKPFKEIRWHELYKKVKAGIVKMEEIGIEEKLELIRRYGR